MKPRILLSVIAVLAALGLGWAWQTGRLSPGTDGGAASSPAAGGRPGGTEGASAGAGSRGGAPGRPGGGRGGPPGFDPDRPQPVQAATVRTGELEVMLEALGTVTARNTVTVRPRVDGQLVRIAFREGQMVRAGEVLAEIDPRPYQVQLDQMRGQLARDDALLANARVDLERYRGLLAKDSIARQQVDAQEALVRQNEGTVAADRGMVDNARLQLEFTRITAPIAGRLGLRQVDVGNMVRAADATGLVVITETQPITTVFAIPADRLGAVASRLSAGESLRVEAWDREGRVRLASGRLITFDNQIDTASGTVKLKAEFANADNTLFPNQFVNVRLALETRRGVLLLPVAAVQRGAQGPFVWRVADGVVQPRPVTVGPTQGEAVQMLSGVSEGERVVTDGVDRLKPGGKVEVIEPDRKRAPGVRPEAANGVSPDAAGGARPRATEGGRATGEGAPARPAGATPPSADRRPG